MSTGASRLGAIFAALWLGEPLSVRKVAGLALGLAGIVMASSLGGIITSVTAVAAILGCIFAPACYGLAGAYIKKKASGVKPMAVAGGSQLFGGIVLLPFLLVSPPLPSVMNGTIVAIALVFAVLCSGVAYLIYYRLIADVGPTKALTVTFLIPVFAMLWGTLFLHETVTASMVAGAVVILLGTFLVAAPARRAARAPAEITGSRGGSPVPLSQRLLRRAPWKAAARRGASIGELPHSNARGKLHAHSISCATKAILHLNPPHDHRSP
jgi:drug/metabolite transporter (DMT)-like permease